MRDLRIIIFPKPQWPTLIAPLEAAGDATAIKTATTDSAPGPIQAAATDIDRHFQGAALGISDDLRDEDTDICARNAGTHVPKSPAFDGLRNRGTHRLRGPSITLEGAGPGISFHRTRHGARRFSRRHSGCDHRQGSQAAMAITRIAMFPQQPSAKC